MEVQMSSSTITSLVEKEILLSRRAVVAASLAAGLVLPATRARAEMMTGSEHHHHGGAASHQGLIDTALACVNRGEVCIAHCLDLLGQGDTSLADCSKAVAAMTPMCALLARYAALDAPRLKELAKVCIDVCDDCAKACEKHASKHEACKACQASCQDCIKACKDLTAA
jgi:Cys-rich four helix bundle protein (predicted Tat secretion target)